jgi:hypothetical protein
MLSNRKFGDFFFVLQSIKIQKEYTNQKFIFFFIGMKTDAPKPIQAWPGHEGEFEVVRFQDNRHMKVLELSAVRFGRFYMPGNIYGTHFC